MCFLWSFLFILFLIELRMHREAGNCYTSAEYGDMDDVTYVRSVLTIQLHTTTDYDRKAKSILHSKFIHTMFAFLIR